MKLKIWVIAVSTVVIVFGGIGVTMAFNLWQTDSSRVPAKYTSGKFSGENNPADIRGSYSFEDVETTFGVPVDVLARAFGVDHWENPSSFECRSLHDVYGGLEQEDKEIGTDSVKLFVALYMSLPFIPEETTVLPGPAVSLLKQLGTLTDLQTAQLEELAIDTQDYQIMETAVTSEEHAEDDETVVKGKATFGDLLDWGVTEQHIVSLLGRQMGGSSVSIRDFCQQNQLEFSVVKLGLQKLVDDAQN